MSNSETGSRLKWKTIVTGLFGDDSQETLKMDASSAREMVTFLLSRAGQSKDELVQVLGREIGSAMAAVMKEPLEKIIENRKLTISIELEPKTKPVRKKTKKKKTSS